MIITKDSGSHLVPIFSLFTSSVYYGAWMSDVTVCVNFRFLMKNTPQNDSDPCQRMMHILR